MAIGPGVANRRGSRARFPLLVILDFILRIICFAYFRLRLSGLPERKIARRRHPRAGRVNADFSRELEQALKAAVLYFRLDV